MPPSKLDPLRSLQATLVTSFRQVIGDARECALVDFPDHPNAGDSAIWLGEIALLRQLGVSISYSCSRFDQNVAVLKSVLKPGGLVLIHGGGNFGTLWPWHQELRETMLRECRGHRVVQLPQSIYYDDPAALARTARLISDHPDFTLLVRDPASLQIAVEQLGARAHLCPDAALALVGTLDRPKPKVDCLVLARTDKERAATDLAAELSRMNHGLSVSIEDWLTEPDSCPSER